MSLAFRQVHLDFHTSEKIPNIGSEFSKEQFQEMLKVGHVNSITVFSKCHHGWSYHPTKVGTMHPELKFDLLGAQIEAAHEIGVKTPVYISAGYDEKASYLHPEWRYIGKSGSGDPLKVGYHLLCFNTGYLDELLAEIKEVCENYDADGIFLDICGERLCLCPKCVKDMLDRGVDPTDDKQLEAFGRDVYADYTRRVRETIDSVKPGLPVFHNGGHIPAGRRSLAHTNTHLELESLPTGGWGYDHFPMSAAYVRGFGMEFLGMTGKFHTTWGEFGGFKHKNALRYEAALSLANGARCSIGDQLHPCGKMDETTYKLIGAAYSEVEQKEPWCEGAVHISDIGVLSLEALTHTRNLDADKGVVRMLLEGNYLFDILDLESDFNKYKVLILPDDAKVTPELKIKLDSFTANGGKILASGDSCVDPDSGKVLYDLGCEYIGKSEYKPGYVVPKMPLKNMDNGAYVVYGDANRVQVTADGEELAVREQPYFNRTLEHFCSHRHAPNSGVLDGSAVTIGKNGAYICWKLFAEYATVASLILRDIFGATLDRLLGDDKSVVTDLPACGVTTLTHQSDEHRFINHLLYATPVKRGNGIEAIEDIVPLYNVSSTVRVGNLINRVYLAPEMQELPFSQNGDKVTFTVPKLCNHAMAVMEY